MPWCYASRICLTDLRITAGDGLQSIIIHAETVNCLIFALQGFCNEGMLFKVLCHKLPWLGAVPRVSAVSALFRGRVCVGVQFLF